MPDWFDFAFWTACLTAVVVGTFDSTRRLVLVGPKKKEILVLAGLMLVSIAFGAFYYWMHVKSVDLVIGFKGRPYVQLPTNWSSEQPAGEREKNSKSYAIAVYLGEGILLKYVDIDGQWVVYQPSQAQMKERESAVADQARMEEMSWGFAKIAWTWWLSCLFAASFGWLVARQTKNGLPNSTVESEQLKSKTSGQP